MMDLNKIAMPVRSISPFELSPEEVALLLQEEQRSSPAYMHDDKSDDKYDTYTVMDFMPHDHFRASLQMFANHPTSQMSDEICQMTREILQSIGTLDSSRRQRNIRRGVELSPSKLMRILSCGDPGVELIISWLPHGRSFIVHDKVKFESEIMPLIFKAKQFRSFARQLNLWNFVKVDDSANRWIYRHDLFLRDMPMLINRMVLN